MHAATTLRTTLGPRQGGKNKKKYIGPEGPSVCVRHFISVDFKGRFSVGSGGGTVGGGGGGGRKRLVPPCAVPCHAVPLGGGRGRPRGGATEPVGHQCPLGEHAGQN